MKNLLLLVLLFLFVSGYGQNELRTIKGSVHPEKGKMNITIFGFKGGYNKSIIRGLDTKRERIGYIGNELYGAFFADTKLNEKLNFENELLFSWTNDYHFIEVPLHLKYLFTPKWSAFAGLKLDIIADNDNDPIERYYRFRNVGGSVELGAQFNIIKRLFVETRYSRGLVNQITDLSFDINNAKRNTFRFGAGIRF
ncbi:MAG: hypothetical protein WKF85_05415 [Chitinophagaceae bacterium]